MFNIHSMKKIMRRLKKKSKNPKKTFLEGIDKPTHICQNYKGNKKNFSTILKKIMYNFQKSWKCEKIYKWLKFFCNFPNHFSTGFCPRNTIPFVHEGDVFPFVKMGRRGRRRGPLRPLRLYITMRVTIQRSQNIKNYDNNYKRKNFRKSIPKKSRFSFLATGRPADFSDFWKN